MKRPFYEFLYRNLVWYIAFGIAVYSAYHGHKLSLFGIIWFLLCNGVLIGVVLRYGLEQAKTLILNLKEIYLLHKGNKQIYKESKTLQQNDGQASKESLKILKKQQQNDELIKLSDTAKAIASTSIGYCVIGYLFMLYGYFGLKPTIDGIFYFFSRLGDLVVLIFTTIF